MLHEYFEEESSNVVATVPCCDVCEMSQKVVDCQNEVKAVLQVVNEIPRSGERKVRNNQNLDVGSRLDCPK